MRARRRAALLLALFVVAGLVAAESVGALERRSPPAAEAAAFRPGGAQLRAARTDIPWYPQCLGRPLAVCVVVRGTGKRVLLMGDSLARMWIPAFRQIAERESLTLAVAVGPACPWPRHLEGLNLPADCDPHREDWYTRLIPQFNPDIVFLANRSYDQPGNALSMVIDGKRMSAEHQRVRLVITTAMAASVRMLQRRGREIVLLEPTPLASNVAFDPIACLARHRPDCSFVAARGVTPIVRYERHLATAPGVFSIDADRVACPRFPICDAVVGHLVVRRDHTHLTATYARAVSHRLERLLQQQHVLATGAHG